MKELLTGFQHSCHSEIFCKITKKAPIAESYLGKAVVLKLVA